MPRTSVKLLGAGDLRPGDVLLSTSWHWQAWLIRWLDRGDFSHAGLYDGERVITAGADGITRRPLYSCEVFRPVPAGRVLERDSLNDGRLLEQATVYLDERDAYVYTPLYLAGLLMIMRRLARPAWRRLLVELLGGLLLARLRRAIDRLPGGVPAVTPSELVVRIFFAARQADGQPYHILVDPERHHVCPAWLPTSGRFEHLMQETEDVLARVNPDLPIAVSQARSAAPAPSGTATVAGGPLAPACFVSPGDLQHSSSLIHLGRLVAPRRSRRLTSRVSAGLPT